jgi:hypothetical protein
METSVVWMNRSLRLVGGERVWVCREGLLGPRPVVVRVADLVSGVGGVLRMDRDRG